MMPHDKLAEERPPGKSLWQHLYFQVLVAIAAGAILGYAWPTLGAAMKPFGDGFIKLVRMVIAPVIFLSVVTGIASVNNLRVVGRLALKAFAYFFFFSMVALIIGLLVANLLQPGAGMNIDASTLDTSTVLEYAGKAHDLTIVGFLLSVIPTTMVSALADGNILQVLFVAILLGVALSLTGKPAEPVLEFVERLNQIIFRAVAILMRAAPIGAFGSIAFTIGKYGVGSLVHLAALVATFYFTSAFFVFVILGAVCRFNGFSIVRLIVYLKGELLLVLGTSSSEAALPRLIEKLEKAGCGKAVVGLVVPTGYSFNLDGTNIYMTLATLFIAQATNTHLSLSSQLFLLMVAMISSKGAAGVTGAGFITLAATLAVVPSVPVAGMALILGVDRFMSECRSVTNFIGNAVATLVVARWENGLDHVLLRAALNMRPILASSTVPLKSE